MTTTTDPDQLGIQSAIRSHKQRDTQMYLHDFGCDYFSAGTVTLFFNLLQEGSCPYSLFMIKLCGFGGRGFVRCFGSLADNVIV